MNQKKKVLKGAFFFLKIRRKVFSHINFVIFSKKEDTTMIIVNKDDISSAVKQAKAMIKPSLLALENSLRFTAKQSRLFIRTNSGGVRFTTMIPCKCDKGKIDFIISVRLISSTLPFLHRKVWNSYLIAGKKSSY